MKIKYLALIRILSSKFYTKYWNIYLAHINSADLVLNDFENIKFTTVLIKVSNRFFADPFVFKNNDGSLNVICEDYSYFKYGKISMSTFDQNFKLIASKELLDIGSHLSYPNVFVQNGKTYIMPESSKEGNLYCYEFDFKKSALINKKIIIANTPLLDSTILFHNGKYWLFATHRGPESNSKLYIYHSDQWDGPYCPHQQNPVKNSKVACRPAGNFIVSNGEIYRPSQNNQNYYGESITINKIITLNENEFHEEPFKLITPPKNTKNNFGIHTINISDGVIVIDGLKRVFAPFKQIKILFSKLFR
jgi:hypothetical protein